MKSPLLSAVVIGLCAAGIAGWAVKPALALAADTVKVNVFPGTANLPLLVAGEKGFFEKHNIKMELV